MRISIFGIGYVGVVTGACLASLGNEVIGVDIVHEKIAMLNLGRSPIVEDEIDRLDGRQERKRHAKILSRAVKTYVKTKPRR